jgi:predicted metal-dependent peptidase
MGGMSMAVRVLENTIIRLLRNRPFYGHLLLQCQREELPSQEGVGITIRAGSAVLSVDSAVFAEWSPRVQEAMLEHGIKHLLHLHMARRKGRNPHDWDICCDLAINTSIEGLPGHALVPGDFNVDDGLTAEEYYDRLATPLAVGNLSGSGIGDCDKSRGIKVETGTCQDLVSGSSSLAKVATLDDHKAWSGADAVSHGLAEEIVKKLVIDAARSVDGELPGELRNLVDQWLQPQTIPWRMVLRQFTAAVGRTGRIATWMRPHRRFDHGAPGVRKRKRLNLLVGIDVSDSTNVDALREAFAGELVRIAGGMESRITVLYANSRIQKIDTLRGPGIVVKSYHGGGFTDLRPVFEYAKTMHPAPAAVIYLTDGIGPAPETMEFPTLWVLTRAGEKPVDWGVALRLEL